MNFEEKKVLINSYFITNFNYCPLVWIIPTPSLLKKIGNLQKGAQGSYVIMTMKFRTRNYDQNLLPLR